MNKGNEIKGECPEVLWDIERFRMDLFEEGTFMLTPGGRI